MATRIIQDEPDRARLIKFIESHKIPFTINITKGKNRSIKQNKLQRLWLNEAEQQGDMTAEEYRGYCKLHFGVPILRAENEKFCEAYDEIIRPHPYHIKIRMMETPLDFPVTRLMTTKQKAQYLDAIYIHFTGLGFVLTEPKQER